MAGVTLVLGDREYTVGCLSSLRNCHDMPYNKLPDISLEEYYQSQCLCENER